MAKITGKTARDNAADYLIEAYVDKKFCALFGIRSSRNNDFWANEKNPQAKWMLPEEVAFYTSLGGAIAREVAEFRAAQLKGQEAAGPNGEDIGAAVTAVNEYMNRNKISTTAPMSRSAVQHERHLERVQQRNAQLARSAEEAKIAGVKKLYKNIVQLLQPQQKSLLDLLDAGTDLSAMGVADDHKPILRQLAEADREKVLKATPKNKRTHAAMSMTPATPMTPHPSSSFDLPSRSSTPFETPGPVTPSIEPTVANGTSTISTAQSENQVMSDPGKFMI